jgi:predicted naringenin-chalcone synthase
VLKDYGNMSSPTILFVLKKMLHRVLVHGVIGKEGDIFGAAFGPGLTMETFIASADA